MQAWADDVNFGKKTVRVEGSVTDATQARALKTDRYEGYTPREEERVSI